MTFFKHSLLATALLATLAFSTSADAKRMAPGPVVMEVSLGQSHSLNQCRGEAGEVKVTRSGNRLNVVLSDVSCTNLDVLASPDSDRVLKSYKLRGKSMPRSASFTLPSKLLRGKASITLRLGSNSGKSTDWLSVPLTQPRTELALGTDTAMSSCGGSVKIATSQSNGTPQVNVVLKDVEKCTSFKIESNNGRAINKSYAIKGGKAGKRSASFTLSWKKVIDKGNWHFEKNNIHIQVAGPRGTEDLYTVAFEAIE